jgi:hypothetical protein
MPELNVAGRKEVTDQRIGPGGGAYNLYVAHDVSFRPK